MVGPCRGLIAPHLGQVTPPEPGVLQFEDLPQLGPADKIPEGELDCPGIGALTAQALSLLDQVFIQHKTCTLHVYSVS